MDVVIRVFLVMGGVTSGGISQGTICLAGDIQVIQINQIRSDYDYSSNYLGGSLHLLSHCVQNSYVV